MHFDFFSQTDTGRLRTNNEDAVAQHAEQGITVLADGMGGYLAGEVASRMATELVCHELARWLREAASLASDAEVSRAMSICVEKANEAIYQASVHNPDYKGMGTTLVMAVFRTNRVLIGHIGDSRAYLWRQGQLQQLTKDHSLLQEQLDAGLITPAQAATSANKNLVTRAMGVDPLVSLEINIHPLLAGDLILLCSDGLTDMLSDAKLADLLSTHEHREKPHNQSASIDIDLLGHSLICAANDAGGRDNIAVSLVGASPDQTSAGQGWWPFKRTPS
jgi:PPM family protein phosphatase